ncbi:MAG: nucleotide-binding universal stress UspA family protein [Crocinitomicaceae bacterium]|jgi:nucleotide-binding universal stress UspA family protein
MRTKNFIVPHDFTDVANIALDHAIATAKPLGAEIYLLHVVAKEKDIKDADKKLEAIIEANTSSVKLIPSIRLGNIFEGIGEFAAEHHAELIFMGTHGAHGWQHVTGMNALKVITKSSVPFIIVQAKTAKETGYDDIVVPLDLNKETKQKLAIVANLAKYFKSRVHVITPEETDEFLRHQVKANIVFAKKYFAEREIEVTTTIITGSGFDKKVVKHAVDVGADLIAIMNLNKNSVLGVLASTHEEYIITNEAQIPTLIMNPIEGSFSFAADFN